MSEQPASTTVGPHLVLVGMMGAGKTTVGEHCATRLGRPFLDTDRLVEERAGRRVAEIFETDGEAEFRALERIAVAVACASPEPAVIACGGGAVLDEDSRRRLAATGFVVWLQAPPEVLARRVGRGRGRPLLATDDPGAVLDEIATARAAAYSTVADVVIDTAGRDIGLVVDDVLGALARCAA